MTTRLPRTAIIGMGAYSPFGRGHEALWTSVLAGDRTQTKVTRFSIGDIPHQYVGGIEKLSLSLYPASDLAVAVVEDALRDAGIPQSSLRDSRVRLYVGTSHGEEVLLRDIDVAIFDKRDAELTTANWSNALNLSFISQMVCEAIGLSPTQSITVPGACASGNLALASACIDLATTNTDVALVICTDALARMAHVGFSQVGALSRDGVVRPFTSGPAGTLISEGAVAFVLCAPSHAVSPLGFIRSYGISADAHSHIHPDSQGLGIELATRRCLSSGGINVEDVNAIYLHGSGTRHNDAAEKKAIERVFAASLPPAAAIKASTGHTMGAAAGIGAVCAIKTLQTGLVPGTAGWEGDGIQENSWLSRECRTLGVHDLILSNAYGFGGINSSLLFESAISDS